MILQGFVEFPFLPPTPSCSNFYDFPHVSYPSPFFSPDLGGINTVHLTLIFFRIVFNYTCFSFLLFFLESKVSSSVDIAVLSALTAFDTSNSAVTFLKSHILNLFLSSGVMLKFHLSSKQNLMASCSSLALCFFMRHGWIVFTPSSLISVLVSCNLTSLLFYQGSSAWWVY